MDSEVNDPRHVWYCAQCVRRMRDMVFVNITFCYKQNHNDSSSSRTSLPIDWPIFFAHCRATINCHLYGLGLYKFIRGFGWAYN